MQLDKKEGLLEFYGKDGLEERAQRMRQQRKDEKEIKLRRKMEGGRCPRRNVGRELLLGERGGITWFSLLEGRALLCEFVG